MFEQPVWNPRGIPDVALVMLYIAVKRSPVVAVEKTPGAPTAAKCRVSIVSVLGHTEPDIKMPLRHSATIEVGFTRIVPLRSIPAGFRTV